MNTKCNIYLTLENWLVFDDNLTIWFERDVNWVRLVTWVQVGTTLRHGKHLGIINSRMS